jgi:hypothetical protein
MGSAEVVFEFDTFVEAEHPDELVDHFNSGTDEQPEINSRRYRGYLHYFIARPFSKMRSNHQVATNYKTAIKKDLFRLFCFIRWFVRLKSGE